KTNRSPCACRSEPTIHKAPVANVRNQKNRRMTIRPCLVHGVDAALRSLNRRSFGVHALGFTNVPVVTLVDEPLVDLEWHLCRGIPLLSRSSPASPTLIDRQVQEADENAHLLLSQSMRPSRDGAGSCFVQYVQGGQARGKKPAIHDPLGTTLDFSEP